MLDAGAVAGLAAVVGLAVLGYLYVRQQRAVRALTRWAGDAPDRAKAIRGATPKRRGLGNRGAGRLLAVVVAIGGLIVAVSWSGSSGDPTQSSRQAVSDIRPADISRLQRAHTPVMVLNGSDVPGLAMRTARRLGHVGFRRTDIGNLPAPHAAHTTVAYTDADSARTAGAIAQYLGLRAIDRATMPMQQIDPTAEVIIVVASRLIELRHGPR